MSSSRMAATSYYPQCCSEALPILIVALQVGAFIKSWKGDCNTECPLLAATLALRAMIDFALESARAVRYGYAAKHLTACAELARAMNDFSPFETHDAYYARVEDEHGRKSNFWLRVKE